MLYYNVRRLKVYKFAKLTKTDIKLLYNAQIQGDLYTQKLGILQQTPCMHFIHWNTMVRLKNSCFFTKKIEENVNSGLYVKSRKYSVCTALLVGAKSQKHFRAENQFTFCISAENPSFLHSYACKKSIKLCILIKKVLFLLGLLISYINCNSYNEGWRLDALLNSPWEQPVHYFENVAKRLLITILIVFTVLFYIFEQQKSD